MVDPAVVDGQRASRGRASRRGGLRRARDLRDAITERVAAESAGGGVRVRGLVDVHAGDAGLADCALRINENDAGRGIYGVSVESNARDVDLDRRLDLTDDSKDVTLAAANIGVSRCDLPVGRRVVAWLDGDLAGPGALEREVLGDGQRVGAAQTVALDVGARADMHRRARTGGVDRGLDLVELRPGTSGLILANGQGRGRACRLSRRCGGQAPGGGGGRDDES